MLERPKPEPSHLTVDHLRLMKLDMAARQILENARQVMADEPHLMFCYNELRECLDRYSNRKVLRRLAIESGSGSLSMPTRLTLYAGLAAVSYDWKPKSILITPVVDAEYVIKVDDGILNTLFPKSGGKIERIFTTLPIDRHTDNAFKVLGIAPEKRAVNTGPEYNDQFGVFGESATRTYRIGDSYALATFRYRQHEIVGIDDDVIMYKRSAVIATIDRSPEI